MIDVERWTPRPAPSSDPLHGQHVSVVPFDAEQHGEPLWEALGGAASANERIRYFGWHPVDNAGQFTAKLLQCVEAGRWVCCAFVSSKDMSVQGMASYMRIDVEHGSVEVGCVAHGIDFAGSTAATEAHYLMAHRAFDQLGYRRYEWKCDDRNAPSHRAARRPAG